MADKEVQADTSIVVEFELRKEGRDKLSYTEVYPHGVVGSFYLSRVASFYRWDGKAQKRIRIIVEPMPE